jgi:hypothetical protein
MKGIEHYTCLRIVLGVASLRRLLRGMYLVHVTKGNSSSLLEKTNA